MWTKQLWEEKTEKGNIIQYFGNFYDWTLDNK